MHTLSCSIPPWESPKGVLFIGKRSSTLFFNACVTMSMDRFVIDLWSRAKSLFTLNLNVAARHHGLCFATVLICLPGTTRAELVLFCERRCPRVVIHSSAAAACCCSTRSSVMDTVRHLRRLELLSAFETRQYQSLWRKQRCCVGFAAFTDLNRSRLDTAVYKFAT